MDLVRRLVEIGRVETVRARSASVIYNARIINIAVASLSSAEKGLTTPLTRKDVDHM